MTKLAHLVQFKSMFMFRQGIEGWAPWLRHC